MAKLTLEDLYYGEKYDIMARSSLSCCEAANAKMNKHRLNYAL